MIKSAPLIRDGALIFLIKPAKMPVIYSVDLKYVPSKDGIFFPSLTVFIQSEIIFHLNNKTL